MFTFTRVGSDAKQERVSYETGRDDASFIKPTSGIITFQPGELRRQLTLPLLPRQGDAYDRNLVERIDITTRLLPDVGSSSVISSPSSPVQANPRPFGRGRREASNPVVSSASSSSVLPADRITGVQFGAQSAASRMPAALPPTSTRLSRSVALPLPPSPDHSRGLLPEPISLTPDLLQQPLFGAVSQSLP